MELYLVRHAIAGHADAARWPDDTERPLTEQGIARFRSAARGLAKIVPGVDRVLSSPWTRARETAEILQESGWPAPQPCPEVSGDRSPAEAVGLLGNIEAASLAFVGHEPHLSSLASQLLTGDPGLVALELKKGGVVFLELADSTAALRWSLSPKILRLLDGATLGSAHGQLPAHDGSRHRPREEPRVLRGARIRVERDMDIVRNGELEATNYFFGIGDQESVLELTYNHDGRSYELGTGYGHIAVGVDDLDTTLARLAEQGIEPEHPPVQRPRGRLHACASSVTRTSTGSSSSSGGRPTCP